MIQKRCTNSSSRSYHLSHILKKRQMMNLEPILALHLMYMTIRTNDLHPQSILSHNFPFFFHIRDFLHPKPFQRRKVFYQNQLMHFKAQRKSLNLLSFFFCLSSPFIVLLFWNFSVFLRLSLFPFIKIKLLVKIFIREPTFSNASSVLNRGLITFIFILVFFFSSILTTKNKSSCYTLSFLEIRVIEQIFPFSFYFFLNLLQLRQIYLYENFILITQSLSNLLMMGTNDLF